jgi:hypothetical protein
MPMSRFVSPCLQQAGGRINDTRLNPAWIALRFGIGLTATLAGIDKFFNLLADWSAYGQEQRQTDA